jgi:hypothetical protein
MFQPMGHLGSTDFLTFRVCLSLVIIYFKVHGALAPHFSAPTNNTEVPSTLDIETLT